MAERKRPASAAMPEAQRPPDSGKPDRAEEGFALSEVPSTAASRPFGLTDAPLALGLVVAVFLVYRPAWHGGHGTDQCLSSKRIA